MKASSNTSGMVMFRPIEAVFNKEDEKLLKAHPYCEFKIGPQEGKTSVYRHEGNNPHWSDSINLDLNSGERSAKVKVIDEASPRGEDKLGIAEISLDEAILTKRENRWFYLYSEGNVVGQIHLDIQFQPDSTVST